MLTPSTYQLETIFPVFRAGGWPQTDPFCFCYPCLVKIAFLLPFFAMQEGTAISCPNATRVVALTLFKSPQEHSPHQDQHGPGTQLSYTSLSIQTAGKAPIDVRTLKALQEATQSSLTNTLCQR